MMKESKTELEQNIDEIVPENVDYSSYVINWLNTNLKDFVEDFLTILYPMMDINEK